MSSRPRSFLSTLCLALALVSCTTTSTRLVTSWRDPGFSVDEGKFKKVLYIALLKDESTRRLAEDHLIGLSNGHGIASYGYLGNNVEALNDPGMNEHLIADGFDGIVIMRLMDVGKEQTYVPGSSAGYYGSPYGYYGYAAPMYYDPGYVRTDVTYTVETNVYTTHGPKLVWTGTTSTVNPSSLNTTLDEIVTAIHDNMVEKGFMRPAPEPAGGTRR